MTIYFLLIAQMIVCAIIYDIKGYKHGKSFWINFSLIALILLAGLRYRMGTDSVYYEYEFSSFPKLWDLTTSDFTGKYNIRYTPLYIVFFSLLRSITSEFFIVQFVYAIFINYAVFYSIIRCGCKDYIFSIVLFYFVNLYYGLNCEVLRESISVGFFLFSLGDLMDKHYKSYYLKILLAIGFHYGAIILLLVPLLRKISINKTFIIISTVLIIFIPVIRLIPVVDLLFQLISSGIFSFYLEQYATTIDLNNSISINLVVLHYIIPVTCCLFLKKISPIFAQIEFLLVVYMIILWTTLLFIPMFVRYNDYVGIFYYVFIGATIVNVIKKYEGKSIVLYFILLMPFVVVNYSSWVNADIDIRTDAKRIELIDPYTSIFNPQRVPQRESIYYSLGK